MDKEKRRNVSEVLDLMQKREVSVKDLSFGIADSSICDSLPEIQRKIKGFLYHNPNIVEPQSEGPWKPKWVSVKDALPEDGQNILCTSKMEDGVWWFGCCKYIGFFPWVKLFGDDDPIKFWMPLPNPPEER